SGLDGGAVPVAPGRRAGASRVRGRRRVAGSRRCGAARGTPTPRRGRGRRRGGGGAAAHRTGCVMARTTPRISHYRFGTLRIRHSRFDTIRIGGVTYDREVLIDRGDVRPRHKKPSKQFRDGFGHTPLSLREDIPWQCERLVVGTGALGALPVMVEVEMEATR